MKAGVLAVAAAIATGVSAGKHARRHAHDAFHVARDYMTTGSVPEPSCECVTVWTTMTGEGSLYQPPPAATPKPVTTYAPVVVPTPLATTCPTPGVYSIPATTVTLKETTTVCGATSTKVPPGTHTAGGYTTVVEKSTTVVCPYAAISTNSGVVTSTILTTTYVCPSAGTYTIAPLTTTCSESTVWVYPTPATYAPGTYTQKEVVTTVTETNYVVFCPYTTPTAAPIAKPVSTYAAGPPPKSNYPASPPPATSYPSGQLGNSGKQWAMTYTPYDQGGNCKSASQVNADISLIASKGFLAVRVYSTDCSALPNIGAACEAHGLKMILGVYINSSGCSGAAQQVSDIAAWAQWNLVELIVLGNEAIFSGYASASDLASFIASSKATFHSAGYSGPCTTAEPLNVWQESASALCGVVDVVGCNIHPFFNSDVSADQAGAFVAGQLQIVDQLCSGKYGVNLETGWPSAGECNGVACPGPEQQATAIHGIAAAVGGRSCILSFANDEWKNPGTFGCEQSWGAIQLY